MVLLPPPPAVVDPHETADPSATGSLVATAVALAAGGSEARPLHVAFLLEIAEVLLENPPSEVAPHLLGVTEVLLQVADGVLGGSGALSWAEYLLVDATGIFLFGAVGTFLVAENDALGGLDSPSQSHSFLPAASTVLVRLPSTCPAVAF